mmetsp:Transcript_44110/g.37020  ORF Transcript_44110/g.37020 Transcript_44110/m.37020 type:complete len:93 (-) Transcript_44110:779-1057(-)
MIGGSSNADAALLVVDVGDFLNNYQWGSFNFKQQTIEHLKIVKTIGIFQLIIAFNKIDKLDINFTPTRGSKTIYENISDPVFLENLNEEFLT